ncbi:formyltransferase family protein [Sutcliffiella cohnii]
MNIYIYGNKELPIVQLSYDLIQQDKNLFIVNKLEEADLAIAPLLTEIIPVDKINAPKYGTLIFHPSLLPVHRGRDAIKWAFHFKEHYTGVTWFWADSGIDTGPICENEVLIILEGESPKEFYFRAVIPAAIRLLQFIINDIKNGVIRKRPQVEENATYEKPYKGKILATPLRQ